MIIELRKYLAVMFLRLAFISLPDDSKFKAAFSVFLLNRLKDLE